MSDMQKPNRPLDDETAKLLRHAAEQIQPEPRFVASLERRLAASHPGSEVSTMSVIRRIAPAALWVLAAIAMLVAINWAIRSIAPQPVPAAHGTPVSTSQAPLPPVEQATPAPSSQRYDWRGTTITLAAELPDGPSEAGVYSAQPQQHATLEEAMALAQRFGINGQAYKTPGELPGTTDFLVTDGKQSLRVRSTAYFSFIADIVKSYNNFSAVQSPQAGENIVAFLHAHGFTFPYRVEWSQWRGAYLVEPLTAEGTPLRYERFSPPMMLFTLDDSGSVARLEGNLLDASSEPVGRFGIISAQAAFQKLLDPNTTDGMIESMNAVPAAMKQWSRSYPIDQTITIYGIVTSEAAVDVNQPAFIQIDAYPVTGQVDGLDQFAEPTQVQAIGRFITEDGVEKFSIDSWKLADVKEDGLIGTLQRQNGQVVLTTQEGASYMLPDVPADVPIPFENANVIGTAEGDNFEWKTIDDRMAHEGGGGGGGGGGGSGFYKLNLTGAPVPFPTATMAASGMDGGAAGQAQYVVQEGDTLAKIAQHFGTGVDIVVQANGIQDPSMLKVGQTLVIPGTPATKLEGLRGLLNITINRHEDGSQDVSYGFLANAPSNPGGYMLLEGDGLEQLQKYNSRPVDIWGTLDATQNDSIRVVRVDRFEIPFPDLKVQVFKGTQKLTQIAGQPATLFTAEDGTTYVQFLGDGTTGSSLIGNEGDQVLVEAVAIPGETVDGKPALRIFAGCLATNPKTGQSNEMPITADNPSVNNMPSIGKPSDAPTATIEKAELIHFMSDPRYAAPMPSPDTLYFQPVWCFSGHYSNGDEFEILIQALQQQYLLPEIQSALQPG